MSEGQQPGFGSGSGKTATVEPVHATVTFGVSETALDRLAAQSVALLRLIKLHLLPLNVQQFFAFSSLDHAGTAAG